MRSDGHQPLRARLESALARRKSPLAQGLVVIFAVGGATALRQAADPVLGASQPFTFYYATVAIAAWLGGFWAAFAAILLSYFTADWLFIAPRYQFDWPKIALDDFLTLGSFIFSSVAIAATSETMHRALRRARTRQELLTLEMEERRRAEESLRRAEQTLRQQNEELELIVGERTRKMRENLSSLQSVCYHIAHDLRAPLRAITAFGTLLQEESGPSLPETSHGYLQRISAATLKMDELISDLLEFGRVGMEELKPARVDLLRLSGKVLNELRDSISFAGATVEIRQPLASVTATERLLQAVLLHLLDNAIKFRAPDRPPKIVIGTQTKGEHVLLFVEDNGVGIPEAYQDRIFRLFEQLEKSRYPGSGMGLAISSKAVERMGGKIGVESRRGEGSRFWIELPASFS